MAGVKDKDANPAITAKDSISLAWFFIFDSRVKSVWDL
jgi:hypothetical protein